MNPFICETCEGHYEDDLDECQICNQCRSCCICHLGADALTADELNGWYCMTCGAEVDECDCSDDDEDFDPFGMGYQEDEIPDNADPDIDEI